MRKNIVAGNWKSNLSFDEAKSLIKEINQVNAKDLNCELIVCPPYLYVDFVRENLDSDIKFGAQNVSQWSYGAYTGEISAEMLSSMNANYCIIGHSERRKYFNESNEVIEEKLIKLLKEGIKPIFCCGETLDIREDNKHFQLIETQIKEALFSLSENELKNIVIAYEPVWAIGTGKTASPEQAEEMHAFIRKLISEKFGTEIADNISILYGGSVKAENAKEIFAKPNVDGGLIGGASLKYQDFINIAKSF
jgi:triosephosphate isomerase